MPLSHGILSVRWPGFRKAGPQGFDANRELDTRAQSCILQKKAAGPTLFPPKKWDLDSQGSCLPLSRMGPKPPPALQPCALIPAGTLAVGLPSMWKLFRPPLSQPIANPLQTLANFGPPCLPFYDSSGRFSRPSMHSTLNYESSAHPSWTLIGSSYRPSMNPTWTPPEPYGPAWMVFGPPAGRLP